MTAVAVWNHRPTARELHHARRAAGWQPTPSQLRDGPRVLGDAACLFDDPNLGAPPAPPSATREETP